MNNMLISVALSIIVSSGLFIQNENVPTAIGYTDTGVYYEIVVQQEPTNEYSINVSDEISTTLVVSFDGVVEPPRTWTYTKDINGNVYSGTLRIHYYEVVNGKTTAEYRGKLYRQK